MIPVTAEFVATANPRQLHREARVTGGSFLETPDGWVYDADAGDDDRMRAAVEGHVPEPYSVGPDEELHAAITACTTLDELKRALLGISAPARVAARPA